MRYLYILLCIDNKITLLFVDGVPVSTGSSHSLVKIHSPDPYNSLALWSISSEQLLAINLAAAGDS